MRHADVIVIGAGIVGAAVAHELAAEGLDVTVFDARLPAATDAGMGHLVVMDDDPAEFALSRESLRLWRDWSAWLPADCAFTRCGTLWIASNAAEAQAAFAKRERLLAAGVLAEWLDEAELAAAEPALRRGLAGALRVTHDAVVYPPTVARALLQRTARPVRFEQARVASIGAGEVRLDNGRRREAAAIVLAGGVHAKALLPELPLLPKKGHLLITDRYPGTVRHQLVELGYVASAHATNQADATAVAFNVQPRPTGQLLIGSSRQLGRGDAAVEGGVLARMLRRAMEFLPGLASLNAIRSWTGARPATPDGLPLIGEHPTRRGLWLALGHEGLGATLAPGTARLLAAQLLGRVPEIDAAPYRPARFLAPRAT